MERIFCKDCRFCDKVPFNRMNTKCLKKRKINKVYDYYEVIEKIDDSEIEYCHAKNSNNDCKDYEYNSYDGGDDN